MAASRAEWAAPTAAAARDADCVGTLLCGLAPPARACTVRPCMRAACGVRLTLPPDAALLPLSPDAAQTMLLRLLRLGAAYCLC